MVKKNGPQQAPPARDERQQPDRQRPAHEIRIGRVRATVWANQHEKQGTWYSVTLTRSYKDAQGQWQTANSFGRDDLLVLGEICRQAFLWIHRQAWRPPVGTGQEEQAEGNAPGGDEEIPF